MIAGMGLGSMGYNGGFGSYDAIREFSSGMAGAAAGGGLSQQGCVVNPEEVGAHYEDGTDTGVCFGEAIIRGKK